MSKAIELAYMALELNEVPVGAIVVHKQKIIGEGYNLKEYTQNVTRHAELIAIEQASLFLNNWRLIDCELYVTLEPCIMCAGAIYQSRISKVVFGAMDPKGGAFGGLYKIHEDLRLNHKVSVYNGVLAQECSLLLSKFFKNKRLNLF